MSLSRKTSIGFFWVSLSSIILKFINFIIGVVLARLLEPQHFGLIAIGLLVVNFFERFRDMGIGNSLIYKKEDNDKAANTAFFLFPIIAILFYFISYLIAPFAADFFNETDIEEIIKILSLIFVIWSFGTLPQILLIKNLEFKKTVIPQILPKIIYGVTAILLAFNGFGVWSLVIGRLVLELSSVLAFWASIEWRPSYIFDTQVAFELLAYGKDVVGGNLIVFLVSIIDVAFIGRILGAEELGYYSIAMGIAILVTSQISDITGRIMFPLFSKLQDDAINLKKAYIKTLNYAALISIPASIGTIIIAQDFIFLLYGEKWLPAVPALQVLCIYGLSRSLLGINESLYLAAGKPKIRTILNLLQLILMLILMYPFTKNYGIFGSSVAVMIPSFFILLLSLKEVGKIIKEKFIVIIKSFTHFTTGSLIMALAINTLYYFSYSFSPFLRLSFSIIIGSVIYITFIWFTCKDLILEIKIMITRR